MNDKPSFWRHTTNGEKGYLVHREGKEYIRLDRPGDPVERVFRPQDWLPEVEARPLSPMVRARIAWAADQELCAGLGIAQRKDWLNLPEAHRVRWMEAGPTEPARRKLYDALMSAISEF